MAIDSKGFEKRLDKIEQEICALRNEVTLLRQVNKTVLDAIKPLQHESCVIAQRIRAIFQQIGVPDQPVMSLAELQAAIKTTLSPNMLTETVHQMREE